MNDHEAQLLADAKAVGKKPMTDRAAFDRVVLHYRPEVVRFFRVRKRTQESLAEDLAQETLLRVLNGEGEFATLGEFKSWLLTTASNTFANEMRKRNAQKRGPAPVSLEGLREERPGLFRQLVRDQALQDPLERALARLPAEQARAEIRRLPPRMRLCAVHYFILGRKHAEIAKLMRISIGAVKKSISDARARLKKAHTLLDHDSTPRPERG